MSGKKVILHIVWNTQMLCCFYYKLYRTLWRVSCWN